MTRGCYVISYDIPDNRRRLKVAHLLEGYGERVQYSVFEIWVTSEELVDLRKGLSRHVEMSDKDGGSIRIYMLCAACRARRDVLGVGKPTDAPDLRIV